MKARGKAGRGCWVKCISFASFTSRFLIMGLKEMILRSAIVCTILKYLKRITALLVEVW